MHPQLSVSRRTRSTPFTSRVEAAGVKAYTVYNHMLLATQFESFEADYWHLCEHVQVWDVSCERQVAITGPDAYRLVQLMTPRDLSQAKVGRCFYLPLCDVDGGMVNDPIAIKLGDDRWWLSIADSDVVLWAKGLATGMGLDVKVYEPDVWPVAVQGPKAEQLMARVFGEQVKDIRFFQIRPLAYQSQLGEVSFQVARSGWSKQGGFEIYVDNPQAGQQLWDELFCQGADLQVRAGCPNLFERLESGLLSLGNDMGYDTTPIEAGLEQYVNLDADIDSLSLPALRTHTPKQRLMGLVVDSQDSIADNNLSVAGKHVGEIRSQCFSPRYGVHLAFVLCYLEPLGNNLEVVVNTSSGQETGKLCSLPFDFPALGIVPIK
ncbi:MAG TPA: dimethylsulfoniopropionate demethylase [Oceanospirillaceae bacterium]|nr:dimethylsulfoniopropionate demethylase [Oceanospirillaceae bacterium]